jgi:enterochelin esterase family protein
MPIVVHRLTSRVLEGNALGDPTERDLVVYLPPGFREGGSQRYPTLLALTGYTGTGAMLFNVDPLGEDLTRKMDRLVSERRCPPAIIVAPDCFTRVGGNQYINSSATGPYEDYLLDEVMPFVERSYPTGAWGVFGKSSGGYGSMVLGMRHPERFAALADHSGDAGFELCYLPDACGALDAYREAGGPAAWLEAYWGDPRRRQPRHFKPLNFLGMAAHYSPNPDSPHLGIDFPFDLETGEFLPSVWERWRAWDPVHMVEQHVQALRRLRLVYVDCGVKDEFGLIWGARSLVARLRRAGVTPQYFEFDDGHMNVMYRYDTSIPLLVAALSEAGQR